MNNLAFGISDTSVLVVNPDLDYTHIAQTNYTGKKE
jgi:hypothetical protein